MNIIELSGVTKKIGGRTVLDEVSFSIKKGETFAIIGGSGCGKSTLLKIMAGNIKPDAGRVIVSGVDMGQAGEADLLELKKKIGVLYQGGALLNSISVADNVALPLREHSRLDEKIIDIIVKMKLELVGLAGAGGFMPSELSGGMRKRAGLARAIVMDPDIIFYDEPGAGLDPVVTAVIDKLIKDLSVKMHITSVAVTHKMESAYRTADRIGMLYEGRIIEDGSPEEIKSTKNPVVRQFITGSCEGPIPLRKKAPLYAAGVDNGG